jgi:hypothetical protein
MCEESLNSVNVKDLPKMESTYRNPQHADVFPVWRALRATRAISTEANAVCIYKTSSPPWLCEKLFYKYTHYRNYQFLLVFVSLPHHSMFPPLGTIIR